MGRGQMSQRDGLKGEKRMWMAGKAAPESYIDVFG